MRIGGEMKTVDIDCSLGYQVNQRSEFIMQIQAAYHPWQRIVSESLDLMGMTPESFTDLSGMNRMFRFGVESGRVDIRYRAKIELCMPPRNTRAKEMEIAELPPEVLHYLLPSRYCESDLLSAMAQRTFGHLPRGFKRVEAICSWIKNNIVYESGSSHAFTTARDVLANRAGVCRDFAHLGIAFCRALNIPARFVFGHAQFPDPPPDFHAVFEAFLDGQWILFDATKMAPLNKIVRIGTGTDAKDVAFATMYGDVQMVYLKPLARDHVNGQAEEFEHVGDFFGSNFI